MKKLRYSTVLLLWLLAVTTAMGQVVADDGVVVVEEESVDEEAPADTVALDVLPVDSTLLWPQNVTTKLSRLLTSSIFETSHVGMLVYDLSADSTIFSHNARQLMRPASTEKMVNAVASLDRLGGSYLFRTRLLVTGDVDTLRTLRGNIYLAGGMDPLFNNDDMRAFVESIRQQGIDTIRGNICADQTMKDDKIWGEGWCWDDDNPDLVPLLINGENKFMKRFCQELRRSGIILVGDTIASATPSKARLLCNRTHTMDQVLQRMLKESDNLFAECLFYQLATKSGQRGPATAKGARSVVNQLIKKVGLTPSNYYIADGSGLSLYNYVSPELEVRLLRYAWENDNILTHLLPALPLAGVDGTLKSRMTKTAAQGNVRAKTGTVMGVSSLAGYCVAANGHQLCFAIMNMGIRKSQTGRSFQDRVCEVLCGK